MSRGYIKRRKKMKHWKKYRFLALIILLLLVLGISFIHARRESYKRYLLSEKLNEASYKNKKGTSSDLLEMNNIDANSIVPEKSNLVKRGVIVPLYDKNNEFSGKNRVAIDKDHSKDGISTVKLTKQGSDKEGYSFKRKIKLSFNDRDTVGFWLYKDDTYNLGAGSEVDISLQSYNSDYNYFEIKIKGEELSDGWNLVKLKKKDFTAMGSALWTDIDHIRVTIKSNSDDNVSVALSSIEVNNNMKPTVILCIDGTSKEIPSYVLPLVSKYNFKITNFLNPASIIKSSDSEKEVKVIADSNGNAIKDANGKSIEAASDEGKRRIQEQKQAKADAAANKTAYDESNAINIISEKQKETQVTNNIDAAAYNQFITSGACEIGLRSEDNESADILNDYNKENEHLNQSKNALFTMGLNINNTVTSYAFSSNSYNDVNGKALKDSQFSFVRNGREGLINYFNVNNKNVVPSVMLNDSNVDAVKSYIDKTIEYNSAICLYTNNVLENNTNGYVNVSNANYEAVLQYLKTKCDSCQLQVVCVSDFVNENK